MISDYGNLHVILSETDEKTGPNPCYEFGKFKLSNKSFETRISIASVSFTVIADRFGTVSEIRRKNSISESYDFVDRSSFSYNVNGQRASLWMQVSVSVGK